MTKIDKAIAHEVGIAAKVLTDLAARLVDVGYSEQVVARASHVAFLQIAGDVVGHPALVTWMRDTADQLEVHLLAAMDKPLQ